MPFRDYEQFDGATLDKMAAAYDAAFHQLKLTSDSPLTSKLAAAIAELAAQGERDVARLVEEASKALAAAQRRRSD